MFTTIIIQPIFNLLVLIYALLPGHNFGLALVIFTIIIRLLLWPMVKKQIRQAKAMRELQPELKRIKKAAAGDRRKESLMVMELYKEREINPMASLGVLVVQIPILIGLYSSVSRIIKDPHEIVTFSYSFVNHLSWIQTLSADIHRFDDSLFGLVNLGQKALGSSGIYWPALILVVASAIAQFFQARQMMPRSKDARGLRQIMKEASNGKTADQSEVNAAVGQSTQYLIPGMVFIFGMGLPAALPLYWFVSSTVAYIQQAKVLNEDVEAAEAVTGSIEEEVLPPKSGLKKKRQKKQPRRRRR